MDVTAKNLDALLLVGFQQRRAGEADENRVRQNRLHRLMQFAGLRPVTFVHEHIQIALGHKILRQGLFHFFNVAFDVAHFLAVFLAAELVNQRTQQPRLRGVQSGHQIIAALRPVNLFLDPQENLFDLLIQFRPVGDDEHPRIGHILPNPLCQPDHDEAFAAALRVPDDATFTPTDEILRRPHREILIVAAELFRSGIEDDEIVDEFQQPRLVAELNQGRVEQSQFVRAFCKTVAADVRRLHISRSLSLVTSAATRF